MLQAMALFLPELGALGVALALFISIVLQGEPEDAQERRAGQVRAAGRADRIALLGSAAVVALALLGLSRSGELFFGAYEVGLFSQIVKVVLALGLLGSAWLARDARHLPRRDRPELMLFFVLATLGLMMLASATELVGFYVALELSAYCLYIVVPMASGHGVHNEASLKYFLYGATISAAALFGMSILVGLAGTTSIAGIGAALAAGPATPLALVAVVLALGGVLFKLAVFPFHFWAPDVYETAADGPAAFIAAVSKVGAIAALLRLLLVGAGLHSMVLVLGLLAVASMTYGNLAAIAQRDVKRLLAYSGVAQGGYILLGLLGRNEAGYAAATYYALGYLGLMFLCFLVVVEVGRDRDVARTDNGLPIEALDGLYRRSPLLAFALLVGLLGLAGVPPTIGFTGKWLLFKVALDEGAFWLVLIAGINNTIAVYYYLLVLKAAYIHDPGERPAVRTGPIAIGVGAAVALAVVLLGLFPQWVMDGIREAAAALL